MKKNGFSQIKGHIKMGYQRGMEGLDQPRAGDSFKAGLGKLDLSDKWLFIGAA